MTRYCREMIQAKTRKLKGTWTVVPGERTLARSFFWLLVVAYLGGFGLATALQLYLGWWVSGLVTAGLLVNELDKLRAVRFRGQQLKWDDRQRVDLGSEFPLMVTTIEGESTIFKPDRYYRLLRRHRHSFYVDDAIDQPGADPLPAMLFGPYVMILRGDFVYFCR